MPKHQTTRKKVKTDPKEFILILMYFRPDTSYAQNLIFNGDAEISPFTDSAWVEVSGNWQQRGSDPLPQNGSSYFFSGADSSAILYQDIDVSIDSTLIDNGDQVFTFSGYLRSWPQEPADEGKIIVEYINSSGDVLETYDSGFHSNTEEWVFVEDIRTAPVGTRSIKITLISIRNKGTDNDGYFDNLQLTKLNHLSTGKHSISSKSLFLSPNPSSGFITISGISETNNRYVIYDTRGAEIETGTISNNEQINIQHLENGLYFLQFENENTLKFLKQ